MDKQTKTKKQDIVTERWVTVVPGFTEGGTAQMGEKKEGIITKTEEKKD